MRTSSAEESRIDASRAGVTSIPDPSSAGPRPAVRSLQAAQLISAIGDGGYYTTSALFFTLVLGLPAWQVALGLTIAWSVGFAASIPLGALADRLGLRRTGAAIAVVTAVSVGVFPLVSGFAGFLAAATLYAVAQSSLGAVRQAAVAVLVPADARIRVRARLQVLQNVGIGIGAAGGGVALLIGTSPAFVTVLLVDALGFAIAAVLLARLPDADAPRALAPTVALRRIGRDRGFLLAALLNAVLLLYMPMLSVVLPLWVVESTTAPPVVAAIGFLLNTVGVAALQGRASRRVESLPDAGRAVRSGGILLGAAALVVGAAAFAPHPLVAAAIVLAGVAVETVAEVRFAAGSWAIGFVLSPADAPGAGQAVWAAGVPVARALGPILLAGAVIAAGPVGWVVAGAVFAGTGAAMPVLLRHRERQG